MPTMGAVIPITQDLTTSPLHTACTGGETSKAFVVAACAIILCTLPITRNAHDEAAWHTSSFHFLTILGHRRLSRIATTTFLHRTLAATAFHRTPAVVVTKKMRLKKWSQQGQEVVIAAGTFGDRYFISPVNPGALGEIAEDQIADSTRWKRMVLPCRGAFTQSCCGVGATYNTSHILFH